MKIRPLLSHLALALLAALPISARAAASFEDRKKEVEKAVIAKRSEGKEAFYGELETQARALMKDFPDKADPYQMLLAVAQNSPADKGAGILKEVETHARTLIKNAPDNPAPYQILLTITQTSSPEKTREILKELVGNKVPADVKAQAQGQLAKLDAIGKPLDIKFKAVDGREVDLASLKGKVVLVDFWATWCGPCVGEVPHVVEAYNKMHDKGFEIVGISFDQEKDKLDAFVKDKKMAWPQYFDGQGWQNAIGQKYGINSIPAMWLVDKKGNLVDMNGRDGLAEKVEKMLAE